MPIELVVLFILIALLLSYLGLESIRLTKIVRQIPIRILVNGTRGKSSVTRLIASILRANGFITLAKTTGSMPMLVLPDGSEMLLRRKGPPTIKECIEVLLSYWGKKLDAVVFECMAVDPYLQAVLAQRILKPTVTVCTNVRADHLDQMGPTLEDIELAFAGTIPRQGVFVCGERKNNKVLKAMAAKNRATFLPVTEKDIEAISIDDVRRFSYFEHKENIALALKVAGLFGIPAERAMKAMLSCIPDIGASQIYIFQLPSKKVFFLNGFAVNDPESFVALLERVRSCGPPFSEILFIANLRADRTVRSLQMADLISRQKGVSKIITVGSGVEVFARRATRNGLNPNLIYDMQKESAIKVLERALVLAKDQTLIIGIGNIKGAGIEILDIVKNRASPWSAHV